MSFEFDLIREKSTPRLDQDGKIVDVFSFGQIALFLLMMVCISSVCLAQDLLSITLDL
jgi:hypothetical protein